MKHRHAVSFLIHHHLFELDQKRNFEQIENGSKAKFRLVIINFEEKSGLIKSETACICFTRLPPSLLKLDQKLYSRV